MDSTSQQEALGVLIKKIDTEEKWNMIVHFMFEGGQHSKERVQRLEKMHTEVLVYLYQQNKIHAAQRILQWHLFWLDSHPELKPYVMDMPEFRIKMTDDTFLDMTKPATK